MVRERISSPADFDVLIHRDVMVPMRDGILLATNLYLPSGDNRTQQELFPALLHRTPYGKSAEVRADEARFFASRGYATVVQDCRGRYASQGGFTKYIDEGPDGYDTVEWVAQQPWSTGQVGTFGLSYAAHTQAALACLNPPHLACMWLDCGGFSNAYLSGCRNGGAFELRQATWAFREALESPEVLQDPLLKRKALEAQNIHDWFQRLPWKKSHSPLRWTADYENYLQEIWGREVFDDYWKQVGLCAEAHYSEFADVPQVHFGGWYDTYTRSTTDNYVSLSKLKRGPIQLIMGPWTHGARSVSHAGDVDLGLQAPVDDNLAQNYNQLRLGFFDRQLKGMDNGWDQQPPVKLFIMGGGSGRRNTEGRLDHGGRWRDEHEWPPFRAQSIPFYLHSDGNLAHEAPLGTCEPSRYLFNPDHPVPTIGGNISSGQPIMVPGGFDQKETPDFYGCRAPYLPLASRSDVLVFQTELLTEGIEVTGPISVHLWVASNAVDTDFTAKLLDVYPPNEDYVEGYALNISDGVLRAKFRNSWSNPELLQPGEVYPITVQLYPTSNLFMAGHRIRLDISSSNFPRFDVNGNTGENSAKSSLKIPALNSIYHDAEHPSHVLLPIIDTTTS